MADATTATKAATEAVRGTAGAAETAGRAAKDTAGKGAEEAVSKAGEAGRGLADNLPMDRLVQSAQGLLQAAGTRALSLAGNKLDGLTGRLTDYVETGGKGLMSAVTGSDKPGGMLGGALKGGLKGGLMGGLKGMVQRITGGRGKGGHAKLTSIVETLDIGAPRRLVYDQWTQFQDFPKFMKKVETVKQDADEKLSWKAQVFLSHRMWKSHVTEQIPDQRIIWHSEGQKGYVDGAVTFHEVTPDLTRILVVLEYHPQGLFERTGNLWRAQGRRVRLELKHFRRHVMAHLLQNPDEVQGWRGEIRDGEVVMDHESAIQQEQAQQGEEEEEPEEGEEEEEPEEGEEEEEPEEGEEEEEPEEGEEEEEPEEGEEEEDMWREEEPEEEEKPPARRATARRTPGAPHRRAPEQERPIRRRRTRTE
ncbi:SRPBCC family protein [Nonomuraea sp. NPDC050643]|uniref:SRPBCC family protein n=1 Tax=Nonomuraea sp. NPDC050643 TaxID=3155660 RepID=UPI0033FD9859